MLMLNIIMQKKNLFNQKYFLWILDFFNEFFLLLVNHHAFLGNILHLFPIALSTVWNLELFFLDWLLAKTRKTSLPCYLSHRKKGMFFQGYLCKKFNLNWIPLSDAVNIVDKILNSSICHLYNVSIKGKSMVQNIELFLQNTFSIV